MKLSNYCNLELPELCSCVNCLKAWRLNEIPMYHWCMVRCADMIEHVCETVEY
jgi:hypothetical protein